MNNDPFKAHPIKPREEFISIQHVDNKFKTLAKNANRKTNFLISQPKHML